MADLHHLLAIYVHAHRTGNSVPPHIDAEARAALAAKPPAPVPADHIPGVGNMVAADGEREAFAQWLDGRGAMADLGVRDSYFRAAALLRQPAPAPVPVAVAERPWERPAWLNPGKSRVVTKKGWSWATDGGIGWYQVSAENLHLWPLHLPHWAIPVPQPPQGGAEPTAPAPAANPLQDFAAALIASQQPMDPDVAAALTPEGRWEMYDGDPAPAADGEREELAQWLDWLLPAFHREHDSTHASNCLRAAALLRQPAPAPVPGWQPISTAPRDGTEILASDYDAIEIVNWNCDPSPWDWDSQTGDGSAWRDRDGLRMFPAWWQPLPDHPPIPTPTKTPHQ